MKVTASDADDPTYGSSARVIYSVLEGEKFFSVDRHTGKNLEDQVCLFSFNCQSFVVISYLLYCENLLHLLSPAFRSPQV